MDWSKKQLRRIQRPPPPLPFVKTDGGRGEAERTFRAEPAGQWDLTQLSECGHAAPPFRVIEPFARRSDCVCRALTLLTPNSYAQVEQWLCENSPDYNPGPRCTGTNVDKFLPVVAVSPSAYRLVRHREIFDRYAAGRFIPGLRATFTPVPFPPCRLSRFVRERPRGAFLVRYTGHVFALIDGAVHDSFAPKPGRLILNAWRVAPL